MDFISEYFTAEKTGSLIFILIGIIAILVGLFLILKIKKDLFKGIAIALITVAIIQIAVGSSVYIQTPNYLKRAEFFASKAKDQVQSDEIPRMEKVVWRSTIYKIIEIGIIIIGLLIIFNAKTEIYKGIGYGLTIQFLILLVLDFIAEKRAHEYLDQLYQIL